MFEIIIFSLSNNLFAVCEYDNEMYDVGQSWLASSENKTNCMMNCTCRDGMSRGIHCVEEHDQCNMTCDDVSIYF